MSDSATRLWKGGRLLLVVAVAVGILLLLARGAASFYTEVLWYRSAGFSSVLWTRILAEAGIKVLTGAVTAILAFLSFRVVARSLGSVQIKRQFGNLEISERIPEKTITRAVAVTALLLGLWLGATFPTGGGVRFLLFLRAPEWGLEPPFLGGDVSFYVFALPILLGVLTLGLALAFLILSFSAAGYAATGGLSFRGGKPHISAQARKHLAVLGAVFLLLLAGRFWLSPYLLLWDGNSGVQGIFGFADHTARVQGLRALSFLTLAAAGVTWWAGFRKRLSPLLAAGIALVAGGLLLVQAYPQIVQRFRVEPNELEREAPYIRENLRFTRMGFGLDELQRTEYVYDAGETVDWNRAARQFAGLPIWTPGALLTTFQEVEARFRYYDFEDVSVDRYPSPSGPKPLAVAVREINTGGIEDPNWQNLHLRTRYLAGMGAVASDATRRTPEGRPLMFVSGIPPVASGDSLAPPNLELDRPSVYFGSRLQLYAIVTPESGSAPATGEAPAPDPTSRIASDTLPGTRDMASGPAVAVEPTAPEEIQGIGLGSLLRKLALAWRFSDPNLLFSSEVSPDSRFVFRRNVLERTSAIAPFLRYLEAPYPVISEGRIIWILEGFTSTRHFPLSAPQDLPGGSVSAYLRNSVKVTVDARSGEVHFYRMDREDPLLEAWTRVFPDLFQPFEEMPAELQAHVRYPRSLLALQAQVLLQYHQETPRRFHGQQDVWAQPQELAERTRPVAYHPEYGIYRLPGSEKEEFLLTTVFVPAGRQNLTGLLAARCDPEGYGELLLYDIPVEEQVPGPRQVEALVEQDPIISQQFSLWRQGGSQVWSGHLHVVPVGRTLLYLEPIFLAAEADAIPELRRFVVSDGRRAAMEPTLEAAIAAFASASGAEAPAATPDTPRPAGEQEAFPPPEEWPAEALNLLERAEESLRNGDWAGFGAALDELRALLRNAAGGGG